MYMQVCENISTCFYTNGSILYTLFCNLPFAFFLGGGALSIPVYSTTLFFLMGAYVWVYPNLTSLIDRHTVVVSSRLLVQTDAVTIQHAISEDVLLMLGSGCLIC